MSLIRSLYIARRCRCSISVAQMRLRAMTKRGCLINEARANAANHASAHRFGVGSREVTRDRSRDSCSARGRIDIERPAIDRCLAVPGIESGASLNQERKEDVSVCYTRRSYV